MGLFLGFWRLLELEGLEIGGFREVLEEGFDYFGLWRVGEVNGIIQIWNGESGMG